MPCMAHTHTHTSAHGMYVFTCCARTNQRTYVAMTTTRLITLWPRCLRGIPGAHDSVCASACVHVKNLGVVYVVAHALNLYTYIYVCMCVSHRSFSTLSAHDGCCSKQKLCQYPAGNIPLQRMTSITHNSASRIAFIHRYCIAIITNWCFVLHFFMGQLNPRNG